MEDDYDLEELEIVLGLKNKKNELNKIIPDTKKISFLEAISKILTNENSKDLYEKKDIEENQNEMLTNFTQNAGINNQKIPVKIIEYDNYNFINYLKGNDTLLHQSNIKYSDEYIQKLKKDFVKKKEEILPPLEIKRYNNDNKNKINNNDKFKKYQSENIKKKYDKDKEEKKEKKDKKEKSIKKMEIKEEEIKEEKKEDEKEDKKEEVKEGEDDVKEKEEIKESNENEENNINEGENEADENTYKKNDYNKNYHQNNYRNYNMRKYNRNKGNKAYRQKVNTKKFK